jgi:hypothetical protein
VIRLGRLAFRVWAREASANLGISPRALRVGLAVGALAAVPMVVAAMSLFQDLTASVDPADTAGRLLASRAIGHGLVLSSMLVGVAFGVLTVDTSPTETLLHMAGASTRQRVALLVAPTAVVAMATALVVGAPVAVALVALQDATAVAAAMTVLLAILIPVGALLALSAHQLLARRLRRLAALPRVHANTVAAFVVMGVSVLLGSAAFDPAAGVDGVRALFAGDAPHALAEGLGAGDANRVAAAAGLLVAYAVLAAAFLWASALEGRDVADDRSRLLFLRLPAPSSRPFGVLVWFEFLCTLRAAATLVSIVGVVAATAGAVVLRDTAVGSLLLFAGPAVAAAIGLRATGGNLANAWLIWTTRGRDWRWPTAKLLGVALVAGPVALASAGVLAVVAGAGEAAMALATVFLPGLLAALLGGAILPVTDEQPLSAAVAGAVSVGVAGGALAGLSRLADAVGVDLPVLGPAVFASLAAIATVVTLTRLRPESVVHPA